ANVDAIFMSSWLLSALAGNTNVVRVSQQPSEQVDLLVGVLRATLAEDDAGAAMRGRILVLTYPHDEATTLALSQACMVRVVWGGDATVQAVRAIPLRPTATELAFPDRFSGAALHAAAVIEADVAAFSKLIQDFCNDLLWFGQQACSSPRVLTWIGEPDIVRTAQDRFWPALREAVARRAPDDSESAAMARVVASFEYAARGVVGTLPAHAPGMPLRLSLVAPLTDELRQLHCGHGLLLERELADLPALALQMTDRDQTLAVFGFDPQVLRAFALALPPRAIDRIVPIGEALAFDTLWDGIDLIGAFTRAVRVRSATAPSSRPPAAS
ncbi:MAG TPA: acyl-CoA reductase, partial [Ramlibacter sp.]|nr:acyl-CoA reductase [Ramlibacter sp.]